MEKAREIHQEGVECDAAAGGANFKNSEERSC